MKRKYLKVSCWFNTDKKLWLTCKSWFFVLIVVWLEKKIGHVLIFCLICGLVTEGIEDLDSLFDLWFGYRRNWSHSYLLWGNFDFVGVYLEVVWITPSMSCSSVNEVIEWMDVVHLSGSRRSILKAIIIKIWWLIWKYRNGIVFLGNLIQLGKDSLIDTVVNYSFMWYVNKNWKMNIKW